MNLSTHTVCPLYQVTLIRLISKLCCKITHSRSCVHTQEDKIFIHSYIKIKCAHKSAVLSILIVIWLCKMQWTRENITRLFWLHTFSVCYKKNLIVSKGTSYRTKWANGSNRLQNGKILPKKGHHICWVSFLRWWYYLLWSHMDLITQYKKQTKSTDIPLLNKPNKCLLKVW